MPRALTLAFLLVTSVLGALPPDARTAEPRWALSGPAGAVVPGASVEVRVEITLPAGFYQDADSPFLVFEPADATEVLGRASSPPDLRDGKESYTGTFTLTRTLRVPENTAPGPWSLTMRLGWQICQKDGVCLLPAEHTEVLGLTAGPGQAPLGQPPVSGVDPVALILALLGALAGGLLLNLMPCVFPVLALKVLGRRSRRESWAFAAGGLGSLTALGLVTAGLALAGVRLGWGFAFQQPLFVWVLTLVFWVFTLQLWGVWTWSRSPFSLSSGVRPGTGRSALGGAFLVLAATPCTAPVLGPALGYAFTLAPAFIPLFFAAVGLGLVAPGLVLSLVPGGARWVPKPGRWMVTAERSLGFLLGATVLYLLWVLTQQRGPEAVWPALGLLGLTAAALALVGRFGGTRPGKALGLLGLVLVAVGSWSLVVPGPRAPEPSEGWTAFSQGALDRALAEGRPVFVDGTAAWCATCQVNEAAVLGRPDVEALMDRLNIVRLRADDTVPNPEVERWLASVGRAGLPVYALYRPGKPPLLFPELLTDGNFTRALEPAVLDLPSLLR